MRVIGIDQSMSSSGIVVFNDKSLIFHDVLKTVKDDTDPYDVFMRARRITSMIKNICEKYEVDTAVIEGLGFGSVGNATRNLAGLQFCIVGMLVEDLHLKPKIITPTSLKKKATGSGKASKDDMVSSIETMDSAFYDILIKMPKTKGRYDLADAFCLGYLYGDQ